MKKLLGIVVLGLMLSGNAYAQLITLTECYLISYKSSDDQKPPTFKSFKDFLNRTDDIENQLYTLDTVTETITKTWINTDSFLDEWYKEYNTVLEKITKTIFKITDLGGNVATAHIAKLGPADIKSKIDIDFESAKVYTYNISNLGGTERTVRYTEQCKKQK
jgi:hypothetical protein